MIDYEYAKKFEGKYIIIYFVNCDDNLIWEGYVSSCTPTEVRVYRREDDPSYSHIPFGLISRIKEMNPNELTIYKLKRDI